MHGLELSIRNSYSEFETLNPAVDRFLDEHRVSENAAYIVRLVVEELVSNVVRHGGDDAGSCTIGVRIDLDGDRVVVRVEDDGREFDPTGLTPPDLEQPLEERRPGGLGIHLVRSLAGSLRYERKHGKNQIEVIVDASGD